MASVISAGKQTGRGGEEEEEAVRKRKRTGAAGVEGFFGVFIFN